MSDRGGSGSIVYEEHAIDRRKKLLKINPKIRCLEDGLLVRTMKKYYGDSVHKLRAKASA